MTRLTAQSVEEICERHRCVARVENNAPLPPVAPYETLVVVQEGGPVLPSLTQAIHAIRPGWEVEDVYVRPHGGSVFQPLEIEPVGLREATREVPVARQHDGTWALVSRRRHPSHGLRVVGIMMAKDEADVIPEVIANLMGSLQNLFFSAGDAATREAILASSAHVNGWAREVHVPHGTVRTDGFRQVLLEAERATRRSEGDLRPTWVLSVQGDEVYQDDVRRHVFLADDARATVLNCQVATFLLHESQRSGWDWTLPLERRLTHYIWDFGEHSGFLDFPWLYYDRGEHMRAHPHGIYPGVWARNRPVRKHYPFRSPDQMRARIEDRIRSGWQPHYTHYQDVFMGDVAAGRAVKPYLGWFPEEEK